MNKMFLGAQLYTIRDFMKNEAMFFESMKKIAEIGYRYVQVSGIGAVSPQAVQQATEENGLQVILTHSNPERLLNDTDALMEEHDIFHCNAIGIGSLGNYSHDEAGFQRFASDFAPVIEKVKKAGKVMLYHNHRFEFEKYNGKTGLEIILENTDPDGLKLTFDTYWAQAGGADPAAFIEKHGNRIFATHLKDMGVCKDTAIMTEVLTGNMNFDRIMEACEKTGVIWHMVEQDTVQMDAFDSMKISFDNLNTRYFHE